MLAGEAPIPREDCAALLFVNSRDEPSYASVGVRTDQT
jgi:hypothetical protein